MLKKSLLGAAVQWGTRLTWAAHTCLTLRLGGNLYPVYHSPTLALALITSILVAGVRPQPAAGAVTCTALTTQRLLTDSPTTKKRVAFVYAVPAGITDERLDVPTACSDGSFRASTIARAYRDMSVWMAKSLASTTGSRRLIPATKSYRNPVTGSTRSMVGPIFVRLSGTAAAWDCRSPSAKIAELRKQLIAKGLNNANTIYAVILHARQTCTSVSTVGVGYLGAAGTSYGYAYTLRSFWAGGSSYSKARYGCANYSADAVLAHEILHVLGGVPVGAPNSDKAGHIRTDHDVLEGLLDGPFVLSSGSHLQLDSGVNDYRQTVFGKGWDTTGYATTARYSLC